MQIDTKAMAAVFADAEMKRLHASAVKRLSDAVAALQPEDFDVAVEHATELFDNAPWLSDSSAITGGMLHLTYKDVFALLVIARERRDQ